MHSQRLDNARYAGIHAAGTVSWRKTASSVD